MCTHHSSLYVDFKATKTLSNAYYIPKYQPVHTVILVVYANEKIFSGINKLSFENQQVIRENAFGIIYILPVVLGPVIKHIAIFSNNCI